MDRRNHPHERFGCFLVVRIRDGRASGLRSAARQTVRDQARSAEFFWNEESRVFDGPLMPNPVKQLLGPSNENLTVDSGRGRIAGLFP